MTASRTQWANSGLNTFGSQGGGNPFVQHPLINGAHTYRVGTIDSVVNATDTSPLSSVLSEADSTLNPQPSTTYTVAPGVGLIPFTVQARGPAPKGPPYSRLIVSNQWDFGDGTVVRVANNGSAQHTYTMAGAFPVRFCSYSQEFPGPCPTSASVIQYVQTVDAHGTDSDGDGLSDSFESTVANLLNPVYHVSGGEASGTQFATFFDQTREAVAAVHGQVPIDHIRVTPLGFYTHGAQQYVFVRLDYLTLWNRDDGLQVSAGCDVGLSLLGRLLGFGAAELLEGVQNHELDNERAAILIAAPTSGNQLVQDPSQYKIVSFYAAAHEWTIFDHSTYLDAQGPFSGFDDIVGPTNQGRHINLFLSRAKHSSNFGNPAGESLFTYPEQAAVYSALSLLYLNGTIGDIEYGYYLVLADVTLNVCITEKFTEAGGRFPQFTINVGEVSRPINGSHFILDPSLEPKLTVPIF